MPSLLILTSAVLYGISPILVKAVYAYGVPTLTVLALRATFAATCLGLGLALIRTPVRLPAGSLAPLILTGVTLVPIQVFGYFWALVSFPASSASVLVYTFPLHVAWMGWVFLGERIRPSEAGLLGGIVAGALLVAGQTPVAAPGPALAAIGVSTLTAALYMVVARRLVRDVQPLAAMMVLGPVSAMMYWAAGLATNQLRLQMPLPALAATLGSGAFSNLIAPLLLLSGLRSVPVAPAAMLGTLEPVITVSLSVLFLGDSMTPLRALGIAIVIGGIGLLHTRPR